MNSHPFKGYTDELFPTYLRTLRAGTSYPFTSIFWKGHGIKSFLKKIGKTVDFPGAYILIDTELPAEEQVVYVGISRKVISRLNQHYRGDNHFSGNLSYKLTKEITGHETTREALKDLSLGRERIRKFEVQFIEIADAIERYLFEVYVHLEYGQTKYNSFDTH